MDSLRLGSMNVYAFQPTRFDKLTVEFDILFRVEDLAVPVIAPVNELEPGFSEKQEFSLDVQS